MKNIQICKSCGAENPFYVSICKKCNFILRDKIVNIDLWSEIGRLVENPANAFRTIIQSEHKNFVISIILFAVIKLTMDSAFLSMLVLKSKFTNFNFFPNLILVLIFLVAALLIYSLFIKVITDPTKAKTRLKDNLAVLVYSLIPHSLALCIIFPIEIAVFGGNAFSTNPSPFLLKPTLAYILSGFELLIIIWSVFLGVVALYSQTRSKIFGFITGLIFNALIFGGLYLIAMT